MAGFFSRDKGEEITLGIEGMSCQHCVGKVEKGLREMAGVFAADVSLEEKEAKIRFDPETVTVEDLKKKVNEVGFTAS